LQGCPPQCKQCILTWPQSNAWPWTRRSRPAL